MSIPDSIISTIVQAQNCQMPPSAAVVSDWKTHGISKTKNYIIGFICE